jgi:hypothetical protein
MSIVIRSAVVRSTPSPEVFHGSFFEPAALSKPRRKRGRKGSKDWRRNRLLLRSADKERRKTKERWMKPSKKPGKKPLAVFTSRSHIMPQSNGWESNPLNPIVPSAIE